MYKTVRQGENSLQYTILPQTEEVLSNSGLKGKGRDYSPSIHVRRTKRKSTCTYVLLCILGTLISIAIASVPIYIVSRALGQDTSGKNSNSNAKNKVFVMLDNRAPAFEAMAASQSIKKELRYTLSEATSTTRAEDAVKTNRAWITESPISTTELPLTAKDYLYVKSSSAVPQLKITTTSFKAKLFASTKWSAVDENTYDFVPLTSSTKRPKISQIPFYNFKTKNNEIVVDRTKGADLTKKDDDIIRPTVSPTSNDYLTAILLDKIPTNAKSSTIEKLPTPTDRVLITTKKDNDKRMKLTTDDYRIHMNSDKYKEVAQNILDMDGDDDYKESEDDNSKVADEVQVSHAKMLPGQRVLVVNRWPFVDPWRYIQWNTYGSAEAMLLPGILAALLAAALVLVTLAIVLRRRGSRSRQQSHIGKLTAELQADDNTNLLTAENVSEDD